MADVWVSQMRKGFVEFCILCAVKNGADYGYAIYKFLNETSSLTFTESTLYPAINRMTKEGLLASYKANSQSGGPPRRHYLLSPEGAVRIAEMEAYWEVLKSDMDAVLNDTRSKEG